MKRYNDSSVGIEGKVISDYFNHPGYNRYTFSNVSEFQNTRNIPVNRKLDVVELEPGEMKLDLDAMMITNVEDQTISASDYFKSINTDGLIIMKDDKLLFEDYYDYYSDEQTHIMMSTTKSFAGLLLVNEIKRGNLSRTDSLKTFIPELAESGFGKCTIGDVLDMQLTLSFSENYSDPNAEIWQYAVAMGMLPKKPDYTGLETIREALANLQLASDSKDFLYTTPITDVVNWVLERVTERKFADNLKHFIWDQYGMERDAYVVVDKTGTEVASGGLCMGLRDAARIGQVLAHDGEYNGFKLLEDDVIDELVHADATYPERYQTSLQAKQRGRETWYYKDQVWVMNTEDEDFAFIGVHGQIVYVNRKQNVVIVKQGSNDVAADPNLAYQIAVMQQIVKQI